MNALRTSLLSVLLLTVAACGPAESYVGADDGEGTIDEESALAASTGRFETFTGADGLTYFHLLAGNGEKVLASQGYTSLSSAKAGIASVTSNAQNPLRYLQREASDGSRYFVLTAANGAIIGMSELYASGANAERGAAAVQKVVANIVASGVAAQGDSRYEGFKGLDSKYYFHVKAANGEIVLVSQAYTSKASATNGEASVKSNGVIATRYEVRAAADGQFYFVLKAANGAVVGKSELYVSRSNAERGAETVQRIISQAK